MQYYESAVNIVLCDFGKIVCGFALILFENSLYFFENIGNHINELVGCTFFPVNGNKPYIALINGKKCNRLNCHTYTAAADNLGGVSPERRRRMAATSGAMSSERSRRGGMRNSMTFSR